MTEKKLQINVSLIDRASKGITRITTMCRRFRQSRIGIGFRSVSTAAHQMNQRFDTMAKQAGILGIKLTALSVGGLYLFKKTLFDTAVEFERYKTILETTEGSVAAAERSLAWVQTFAKTTPYEIGEVTDSFVKLRAYGLDPTKGLLRSLGDASSAMGKTLTQAVEAIADAVTGENERLKEFGIKARAVGEQIMYEWTENGKTLQTSVQKSNRAMIQSTLEAIFNRRYAGAMEKQSKTMAGLISNLKDMFTDFQNRIINSGLGSYIKDKLGYALSRVNKLAASGDLDKYARVVSEKLVRAFESAWRIAKKIPSILIYMKEKLDSLSGAVGGYKNLLIIVAGLMAGKLLYSTLLFTGSVIKLSWAVGKLAWVVGGALVKALVAARFAMLKFLLVTLANPWTWIIAGIMGVITTITLLIVYWDEVKAAFLEMPRWLKVAIDAFTGLLSVVTPLVSIFRTVAGLAGRIFGNGKSLSVSQESTTTQKVRNMTGFSGDMLSRYLPMQGKVTAPVMYPEKPVIPPAGNQHRSETLVYSPQISIGTAGPEEKADFEKMLQQHKAEIARLMKDIRNADARVAY